MSDSERLALLEIQRLGGVVNFYNPSVEKMRPNELGNVFVGADWKGGDETFMILAKVPSLKSLLLARDAGISEATVGKLRAAMPDLTIKLLDRTPSPKGAHCHFRLRNTLSKEVAVYWIDYNGQLKPLIKVGPGRNRALHSSVGARYEAHLDGKVISKFTASDDAVWEIKPK